jgi:hypothetical protein
MKVNVYVFGTINTILKRTTVENEICYLLLACYWRFENESKCICF